MYRKAGEVVIVQTILSVGEVAKPVFIGVVGLVVVVSGISALLMEAAVTTGEDGRLVGGIWVCGVGVLFWSWNANRLRLFRSKVF